MRWLVEAVKSVNLPGSLVFRLSLPDSFPDVTEAHELQISEGKAKLSKVRPIKVIYPQTQHRYGWKGSVSNQYTLQFIFR